VLTAIENVARSDTVVVVYARSEQGPPSCVLHGGYMCLFRAYMQGNYMTAWSALKHRRKKEKCVNISRTATNLLGNRSIDR
jgi:hypothetical protein